MYIIVPDVHLQLKNLTNNDTKVAFFNYAVFAAISVTAVAVVNVVSVAFKN